MCQSRTISSQKQFAVRKLNSCSLRSEELPEVKIVTVFAWVLYEVSLGGCEVFFCHTLVSQFLRDTQQVAWIRIPMTVTHTGKHVRTVTYYMLFSILTLEGKGVNLSLIHI